MHTKNKALLFILCLFTACNSADDPIEGRELRLYDKKITSQFIKQEKKTRKLRCIGTGLEVPDDKILRFSFIFLVRGNPSIEEARPLIVSIIRDCTELISNDSDSSKFLIKPPESIENAQIAILFNRTDGQENSCLTYVSSWDEKVYYSRDKDNDRFEHFYEETFEEAERILAEQNKPKVESVSDAAN